MYNRSEINAPKLIKTKAEMAKIPQSVDLNTFIRQTNSNKPDCSQICLLFFMSDTCYWTQLEGPTQKWNELIHT